MDHRFWKHFKCEVFRFPILRSWPILRDYIREFLEESDSANEQSFAQFCDKIRKFQIDGDREEMTQFQLIIKSISDHHHRDINFIPKIQKILQQYQEQIKQTLSNEMRDLPYIRILCRK